MGLPVWVTVVISRLVGGFVTGVLGVAVFATVLITNPAGTPTPQSSLVTYSFVLTIVSTVVIGLVLTGLLPALSGCRVSLGTALLASLAARWCRSSAGHWSPTRCSPRARVRPR
jgi:hypothetical protein